MEITRKEDHLELYIENRYFIIPNDVEIYEINLPNLFDVIYDILIKKEYTFITYSRYLTLNIEFNIKNKKYKKELICDEIFPYSMMKITIETSREDLLKCIECLRNNNTHLLAIIDNLEEELNDPEKEYY